MQANAVAVADPNKQREYLKKKKQRKLQRFKELEEERELEKNKWLAFTNKVSGSFAYTTCIYLRNVLKACLCYNYFCPLQSTKKGVIKKSIFATPENVNGRVGIGTCGVSGREMTKFSNGEKWRRGA